MKKILAMLLAAVMVVSLAACGSSSSSASDTSSDASADTTEEEESSGSNTVVLGTLNTNKYVSPFDAICAFTSDPSLPGQNQLIYEPLLLYLTDGTQYSRILESWEWVDDYTLVLQLKDDVYFADGTQMTGDDIIYSQSLMQNGLYPLSFMYGSWDLDASTVSDDGLTVTLVAYSIAPQASTFLDMPIYNEAYIESLGGGDAIDWTDPSVVLYSGPYECIEYVADSYSVYQLREDYWGYDEYNMSEMPETIKVILYSDATALMADYQNGIINAAFGLTSDDYEAVLAGEYENTEAGLVSNNFVSWLAIDLDGEYTSDIAVREAICYAIDVDTLTTSVMGSLGIAGDGLFASGMLGYTDDFQYEYDPDYAKEVLEAAGYEDGEVTITYAYKSEDSNQAAVAELVQAYLSVVGITVELVPMDESTYSEQETVDGYSDLAFYYMSNGASDPGQFSPNLTSSANNTVTCRNGLYDEVIDNMNGTTDSEVRAEYAYELQELMYENFDILPLFEYCNAYLYNTSEISSWNVSIFYGDFMDITMNN